LCKKEISIVHIVRCRLRRRPSAAGHSLPSKRIELEAGA
jgi:hypothetical protein